MPRPRAEWDFYSGEYWDKRFGKKGPWSEMAGTDMSDIDDWECPECQYDRKESGDQPKPEYCPLCLSDSGHLVRIRYKK